MEIAIIPRFIIRKFISNETNQIHVNIMITSTLVIIVLLFWHSHSSHLLSIPHFCVFQQLLNMPCPGCGLTRSIFAVAEGNILSAWKFNPAGLFLFFYFFAQIPSRIIALKCHTAQECISRMSRVGSNAVIYVLCLVWIVRLS